MTVLSLVVVSSFSVAQAQKKKTDSTSVREIDELVVVAYGKQAKETMVGSNKEIKAKDLAQRSMTNVAQALDGAAPGIQISSSSGQPGSAPEVRIRGFSSVNTTNEPLYIVDGTVYLGSIANISSEDIESINILKDAASTSLYGSSAANGIVMITTKKGKKGKPVFNFSATTGISTRSIPEYERLNAAQYYPIIWEALRNGQLYKNNPLSLADANNYASQNLIGVLENNVYNVDDNKLVIDGALNPNAHLRYTDLDWQKEFLKKGIRQNYDLNYSGASENSSYYASIGYLKEDSYVKKSDFERFNARLNIDSKIKSWLKIGTNISLSNNVSNFLSTSNASYSNPFNWTRNMGPIYNVYAHDPITGAFIYDNNGNKVFDPAKNRGSNAASGRHIIHETLLNTSYSKTQNVNSRFFAEFKLLPELTLTTNVGYDTRNYLAISYDNKILGNAAPAGASSRENEISKTLTFNQLLNYNKNFGQHGINALLGHENIDYRYEYQYGRKTGQVVDGNDHLINFTTPTSLTSYDLQLPKESYFARLNYDFAKKYLLSASVRRDGSARFHQDVRWHTFWSVGAGWNIDKENFLRNSNIINKLQLRGSYGQVGNDGNYNHALTSFYSWQPLYNLGFNNTVYGGVMMSSVGNKRLTWESNNQFDLGLEFGLFNNRISGSVEYYKRGTSGMIFDVPRPDSSGNTSIKDNIGDMENSGIEIALNADVIRTQNFRWSINLNASTIKNELTKLSQNEIINGTKKYMAGRSIYDYWLRQWYGVDPTDGMGLFYASDAAIANYNTKLANGETIAASEEIRDINGNKLTTNFNNAKFDYSGSVIPKLFGSFGTSLNYKRVSLSALFTYQIGGKIYDGNYQSLMAAYTEGNALSTDILNRWQKPGDITNVPRMDALNFVNAGQASNRWLTSASYITLRQVTLSYEIPREVINDLGINNLKFFVNGENIWSKTSRKGLEPGGGSFSGETENRFTPSRIFSFGFSTSF